MASTSRWGITVPFTGVALADHESWYRELADLGYTDLWTGEADAADGFTPLALAAAWEPRLYLGTAVAPVYTRGPALLAQTAATMAEAAPGRFALGIGASSDVIVEGWNGIPYDRPYARVRDTIRFLRRALANEKVTEDYETFSVRGFRLGRPVAEPVPIYLAALRPGMLGLAGREADGVILNWLSATDVAKAVAEVGPSKEVVARIFVIADTDAEAARAAARWGMAAYLNVSAYAEFHRWLGRAEILQPMWDAWAAGDRKGALEAIPDSVVDDIFIHGTPEACRAGIEAYLEAGVTIPVLMVSTVGGDLRKAVADLAPGS